MIKLNDLKRLTQEIEEIKEVTQKVFMRIIRKRKGKEATMV